MKPLVRLTIPGAPRTKKTSNRVVRAGRTGCLRILPSEAYERWCSRSMIPLEWRSPNHQAISVPVNCRALFYRDANAGDAVGYYQGLADLLERAGIVQNDRLIVSWDGSRLLKDAKNPRVEVEITPCEIPAV